MKTLESILFAASLSIALPAPALMMTEEMEAAQPASVSGPQGQLILAGQAGPTQLFQRAKAARCAVEPKAEGRAQVVKGSCATPVYFNLNEPVNLPAGSYLLGFENSLYPGLVEVKNAQTTRIELVRVELPPQAVEGRVYRDFTKLAEQRKQYFYTWGTGAHFFLQAEYEFGDFYLAQWPVRPAIPNLNYDYCVRKGAPLADEGAEICRSWKGASFLEITDLFEFDHRGRFTQYWVGRPGGVFKYQFKRNLVGAPLASG
ncbi:MAG TPA: hypothetical protein VFV50_00520, partial [Bdellovibrionales bacterium]|nr:hypothetical protein [Bdellovibrionales bacterium]